MIFCRPSQLQLSLYRRLLASRLVRSCLIDSTGGSRHLVCIAALKKICNHPSLVFGASQEAATNLELDDSIEEESLYDGLLSVFPQDYDDKQVLNPQESGKLGTLSKMLDNISSMDERVVVVSNYTQVMLLNTAQFGNLELLALLQWIYAYVPSNFYVGFFTHCFGVGYLW